MSVFAMYSLVGAYDLDRFPKSPHGWLYCYLVLDLMFSSRSRSVVWWFYGISVGPFDMWLYTPAYAAPCGVHDIR